MSDMPDNDKSAARSAGDPVSHPGETKALLVASETWVKRRPWLFGPIIAINITLLASSGYPRARVIGTIILMSVLFLRVVYNAVLAHRRELNESVMMRTLLLSVCMTTGVVWLSGGSMSPFAYVLPGPCIAAAA